MRYTDVREGIFLSRSNRFIARVKVGGEEIVCHVKNTGRCKELLEPGARVILEHSDNPHRKTAYSLVAVYKGSASSLKEKGEKKESPVKLVNMDSQAPNEAVWEWLVHREGDGIFGKIRTVRREVTYGNSRFDFYLEAEDKAHPGDFSRKRKIWMEVKGVTLEEQGVASFPDAPTERGLRHVQELTGSLEEGYEAYLLFVVQMKGIHEVRPNWVTQKAFGEGLVQAARAGVNLLAYDCQVTPREMIIDQRIPVFLGRPI